MGKIKTIFKSAYDYSPKCDPWGTAMQAHFDVAGEMWNRGLDIPSKWEYSPGMGTPAIDDDSARGIILGLTDEELEALGSFLNRLTDALKKAGHSY